MRNSIIIKDITLGGLLIALFISLNFVFGMDVRLIQTYLEIPKTAIVAIYSSSTTRSSKAVFLGACLLTSFLTLPIQVTLIYNIPCMIGGLVIGCSRFDLKCFLVYFAYNSFSIAYEFYLYLIFVNQNLFNLYVEDTASLLRKMTGFDFAGNGLMAAFVIFLLLDSAFSSAIIFAASHILMRRLNKTKFYNAP